MSDYTERVERGAALLDARRPGWVELIDLGLLDLANPACCVLGQIYDGNDKHYPFAAAIDDLFADDPCDAVEHGFETASEFDTYDALTAEWRHLIESRRAAS